MAYAAMTMPDAKERPIIFSGLMVRAIRDGRKTQTRRVIVPQPDAIYRLTGERIAVLCSDDNFNLRHCPFRTLGRLWVKETWRPTKSGISCEVGHYIAYRADPDEDQPHITSWRSARYMPRWASRILLEVTDVRVQQVQEIGEADAEAESCKGDNAYTFDREPMGYVATAVSRFHDLWNSLNAKRGYGWDADPWVWPLTFKVLDA